MTLEDLEREIMKVTQQGGMARVPEESVLEAMEAEDEEERRTEMAEWVESLCAECHLKTDQDKDMFGAVELLFFHPADFHGHN